MVFTFFLLKRPALTFGIWHCCFSACRSLVCEKGAVLFMNIYNPQLCLARIRTWRPRRRAMATPASRVSARTFTPTRWPRFRTRFFRIRPFGSSSSTHMQIHTRRNRGRSLRLLFRPNQRCDGRTRMWRPRRRRIPLPPRRPLSSPRSSISLRCLLLRIPHIISSSSLHDWHNLISITMARQQ